MKRWQKNWNLLLKPHAEGALLGKGIAGLLSKTPVDLGAEEENKVDDEPNDCEKIVVPEELTSIENTAEKVAANNDATSHGRGHSGIIECLEPSP